MKLSYYTVDDMSLPRKKFLRKGWTIQHFETIEEAISHYISIPSSKDKRLGLTDGMHVLELVRCVPLFEYDTEGEDILASDYTQYPLWSDLLAAKISTQICTERLHLRYMLYPKAIMPIPTLNQLPKEHRDKYLVLGINHSQDSAIRWVYIAGTGWVSLEEWKRRASSLPLVLKYQVDGLTERGSFISMEILPWEYDLLVRRTLERLNQIHKKEER